MDGRVKTDCGRGGNLNPPPPASRLIRRQTADRTVVTFGAKSWQRQLGSGAFIYIVNDPEGLPIECAKVTRETQKRIYFVKHIAGARMDSPAFFHEEEWLDRCHRIDECCGMIREPTLFDDLEQAREIAVSLLERKIVDAHESLEIAKTYKSPA